jgi:hypothetical protein
MSAEEAALARTTTRARALLEQPFAFIEPTADGYRLRLDEDRRRRPALSFGEAVFAQLAQEGALATRPAGGWRLARTALPTVEALDRAGRPGVLEGERTVIDPDGRTVRRRANLAVTPLAWLAARRDAAGRPLLHPAEAAAAERLAADHAKAGTLGRLTMAWGEARGESGGWRGFDPAERVRFARVRLLDALGAMDPDARAVVEQVCLSSQGLEAAERALGLRARSGRERLLRGLRQLAVHYGLTSSDPRAAEASG